MTFTHGFQSTLPARGATSSTFADLLGSAHFNPRSPHGERPRISCTRCGTTLFQSTLPARGATENLLHTVRDYIISIHAPRTGSDMRHTSAARLHLISTTLPARGATRRYRAASYSARFQSTLPARGATAIQRCNVNDPNYFNPRSPHGERRRVAAARTAAHIFQSTLPARGATSAICFLPAGNLFQSTLPARGATRGTAAVRRRLIYFNPRSPHGERLKLSGRTSRQKEFQSTLPARGATKLTFVGRKR